MFSRRSARRRRASGIVSFAQGLRSRWSHSDADRICSLKRGYSRRLKMEALEDRRMLVVGAFDVPQLVSPGQGFDGVVALDFSNTSTATSIGSGCTGTLLSTGRHIITAAHCVDDNLDGVVDPGLAFQVVFEMNNRNYVIPINTNTDNVVVAPGWDGTLGNGADLAIIELPIIAPFAAERFDVYRGTNELDDLFVFAGYGLTGTGMAGQIAGSGDFKRLGHNEVGDIDTVANGDLLRADFDDGTAGNNTLGDSLGLGDGEAATAAGDSGAAAFIDDGSGPKLAGINSFSNMDNVFGDIDSFTRVSGFTAFIDGTLDNLADIVLDMSFQPLGGDGVPDEIVARLNPAGDTLELLVNGQEVWSDLLTRVSSLSLVGSGDSDTFTLDGDLEINVDVDGLLGFDSLKIIGDGTDGATYTPSNTTPGNGTIDIGVDTVTFANLEPIVISALANFTLTTPNSQDNVLVSNGPLVGQNTVSGTSGGVPFESVTFFDIATFTVDMATNDGGTPNDIITFDAPIPAQGLTTFNVQGGIGQDRIVYRGTDLNDTFNVSSTGQVSASNASNPFITVSATTTEQLVLAGLDGDDTFNINGAHPFTGNGQPGITIEGGDPTASDVLNLNASGGGAAAETVVVSPAAADPTQQTITGLGGAMLASGVELIRFTGNPANGGDNFRVELGDGVATARVDAAGPDGTDKVLSNVLPEIHFTAVNAFELDGAADQTTAIFVPNGLAGATTHTFDSDNAADTLVIEGTGGADAFNVSLDAGANLRVANSRTINTTDMTATDQLTIRALDGNDGLTVTVSAGRLVSTPISYDGGTGADTLTVTGNFDNGNTTDNSTLVRYTPGLQPDEGRLQYTDTSPPVLVPPATTSMDITFDNIEPVNDTTVADRLTVSGNGSANAITVSAPQGAALATVAIDGFETITFNNKADLTVNAAGGDDIVNINIAATAAIPALATLTLNGNDGNDTVRFQNLPTAAGFTRATVNAGSGNDTIDAGNIPTTTVKPLTLNGDEGKDTITGGPNGDNISGGEGDDIIIASPGNDVVNGDGGVDQFHVIGRAIADIILANHSANNALDVTYNGNVRNYTVTTLELVQIDAGLGDDFIGIDVFDAINPAFTLPFNVIGNSPNASDRLIVNDAGLGDLVIQRQGPDHRSGSITIGANTNLPADGAKARVFYEAVERVDITPITPFGLTGTPPGGRLIVFHTDENESNDTELTATPIGPNPIFLGPLNIDPGAPNPALPPPFNNVPGDNDWYEFRPNAIGTFQFEVLFEHINLVPNGREGLPGNGNLRTEIYNQAGVLLAASDISVDTPINVKTREVVAISGAPGNSYFLRVFGSTTDAINVYELNVQQIDNDGPQVTDVFPNNLTTFDLFDPKPVADGATPLIHSLTVTLIDQPPRAPGDPYPALDPVAAAQRGLYQLIGDHVGIIDITSVTVVNDPVIIGLPATASVTLHFAKALPDDRFTLRILDGLVDPVGNELDGESDAAEPAPPHFPSGNGLPGGDFVARFTVDTRPEIGAYVAQDIDIDINGNFVWDPANAQIGNDHTNVDLTFTLNVQAASGAIGAGGYNVNDLLFSGKFTNGGVLPPRLFEQLGAYGFAAELGNFRFLIDTNGDGVVSLVPGSTDLLLQLAGGASPSLLGVQVAGAIPIAGDFNNSRADGDEIGLYIGGRWLLDTNSDYIIDTLLPGTDMLGAPIVGDFDGDGDDDLAVFNNNVFKFDMNRNGFADGPQIQPVWGFPGVTDRPIAADMDQDGIDDIGLWVPRNSASIPQGIAEWYFLVSGQRTAPLTSVTNAQVFASTNLIGATVNVNDLVRIRSGAAVEQVGRVSAFNAATGQITLQAPLTVAPAVGDIISVGGTQNTIVTLNHPFEITPFGNDIAAEFGDELALPIVGNFDPPAQTTLLQPSSVPGDYDGSGSVTNADSQVWRGTYGSTSSLLADGSKNGVVDAADYILWRNARGNSGAGGGAASLTAASGAAAPASATSSRRAAVPMFEASTIDISMPADAFDSLDSVFDQVAPKESGSSMADYDAVDDALLLTTLAGEGAARQEFSSLRLADDDGDSDDALDLVLADFEAGGGFDLGL